MNENEQDTPRPEPVVRDSIARSETIGALTAALAKAQGAMTPAGKSADNPFFKSKYADLAAVVESARAPLASNGLAVIQLAETKGHEGKVAVGLTTILAHSSGEWISSRIWMLPADSKPQSVGSALTYARRYGFAAIVGVVAVGEDDDGNAASGNSAKAVMADKPKTITPDEYIVQVDAGRGRK